MKINTNQAIALDLPKKLQKYIGRTIGQPNPMYSQVPVDLNMAVVQRDLDKLQVEKWIETSSGLDWDQFENATTVIYPDGVEEFINGLHRTSLALSILPDLKTVPAHRIDLRHLSMEDAKIRAANLFARMNGVSSRQLNTEQLFWANVHGLDPVALHLKDVLERANLRCGKVNDDGTNTRKKVKLANFEKCVKMGEKETIYAAMLIDTAYPKSGMNDNLLSGLTRLITIPEYSDLAHPETKLGSDFKEWFTRFVPPMMQISQLGFAQYRNTSRWYDGVAYGLYQMFRHNQDANNRRVPDLRTIEKIYRKGIKQTPVYGA